MINFEQQLKIQALLDGELPEVEAREIAALIARDSEAAGLHAELKNTRRATAEAEAGIRVPETREFYWSKIQREIERGERTAHVPKPVSAWQIFIRWLKPLGAVALAMLVSVLAWDQLDGRNAGTLVTAQVDEDAITFQDDATGTMFVWFDYPSENGVADDANDTTLE